MTTTTIKGDLPMETPFRIEKSLLNKVKEMLNDPQTHIEMSDEELWKVLTYGFTTYYDVWGTDDIKNCAECEMDVTISDEVAERVLSGLGGMDADVGINWKFIRELIEQELRNDE